MAAAKGIRAGRAFVELFLDQTQLEKGLGDVKRRLRTFGKAVSSVGKGLFGGGAAIATPLLVAAKSFAAAGDQLNKLSDRTGISVEQLSLLKFAAEQSGSSIDALGKGILRMNRRLGRITAGQGTGSQVKALEALGLSAERLDRMNAQQRLLAIADAMAKMEDPAEAAGLAQRAFGTAVDDLLPLLLQGRDGIRALTDEGRRLGAQMSGEDADAASEFTDALHELWTQMKAVTQQIGAGIAVALTPYLRATQAVGAAVIRWTEGNRGAFVALAKLAGGVAVIGGALTALGTTVQFVAFAVGGLTTAVAAYHKVVTAARAQTLGFRVAAAGLAVAGIIALATAIYQANPAVKELNKQLAVAERTSRRLGDMRSRQQRNFLADVSVLGSPDEKRAALSGELEQAEKNIEGIAGHLENAQAEVDRLKSGFVGFAKTATGNKILANAKKHVEETRERLEAAKDWADQLRDAMKGVDREAKLAEQFSQQAPDATNASVPQPDQFEMPDGVKDALREMDDAFQNLKPPKEIAGPDDLKRLLARGAFGPIADLFGEGSPLPDLFGQLFAGADHTQDLAEQQQRDPGGPGGTFSAMAGRMFVGRQQVGEKPVNEQQGNQMLRLLERIKRAIEDGGGYV